MSKIPRAGQSWKSKKQGFLSKITKNAIGAAKALWKKMQKAGVVKNAILASLALGLLGIIAFLALFAFLSRDLPDPNALTEREIPQATKIYDNTGEHLLYEIYGDENRTLAKFQ